MKSTSKVNFLGKVSIPSTVQRRPREGARKYLVKDKKIWITERHLESGDLAVQDEVSGLA